ncbi:unnamed protein product [Calicophoron daubneyi]|uniref:Thioredoxin domain-containing protein n=1 Tax=Calicophoron daubneyi TaxID=300641 RepID=A0AAV2TWW5_CALDB
MQEIVTLLLFVVAARQWCYTYASDVIVVTDKNFSDVAKSQKFFMLMFSVDWCTGCRYAAPEYEYAARELKLHNPPIPSYKVNGMTEHQLVQQFHVDSYPSVFMHNNGRYVSYEGDLSGPDLVRKMEKEAEPYFKWVNDLAVIESYRGIDESLLLGLFTSTDHPLIQKFERSLHAANPRVKALASTAVPVREFFNVTAGITSILLLQPTRFAKNFASTIVNLTKYYTNESVFAGEITSHILRESRPLIGLYSKQVAGIYEDVKDQLICLLPVSTSVSKNRLHANAALAKQLRERVVDYMRDKVRWVIADELEYPKFVESFQNQENPADDMLAACKWNDKTYQMSGEKLSMKTLKAFVTKTLIQLEMDAVKTKN